MSGRKQHYIPQFLLRGFAEPGKGKKLQVRVITRDSSFVASTEGVAAQREFYSKLGEESSSLDNLITEAETEYSEIYQRLIATRVGESVSANEVARLVTHLTIRSGHVRDTVTIFGHHAIKHALETVSDPKNMRIQYGLDLGEPNDEMRRLLDQAYEKQRPQLSKARVSRHEFRGKAFQLIKPQWNQIFDALIPQMTAVASMLNVSQLAGEGHKKALAASIEPSAWVERLSALDWHIKAWADSKLVLPDSIAIAHQKDFGAVPLFFAQGEDLDSVLFPLTPSKAVCAGTYASQTVLDTLTANFLLLAAAASWNFVVAPPTFQAGPVIGTLIGQGAGRFLAKTMEEALSDSIAQGIAG